MRFFASILTIFVLLLSATPLSAHKEEIKSEKHCCEKKKSEKKKDHCCNKGCNPFLSCCGGMGFILQKNELQTAPELSVKKETNFRYIAIHSNYINDLWQPPKI